MLRAVLVLALSATFAGCALSPQMIDVKPVADVEATNVGQNQPVQVLAVDSRDQEAFGTRGGVNAFNPGENATRLEVRLEQLDYVPEEGSVVNEVTLTLTLLAEASRGDVLHTGTYKSSVVHDLPLTPSASRNQQMVNDILSGAINRLLKDPEMLAFLAGNDQP